MPAAAGLRSQGAGKGATTSFLISTPETGVDSVAISWAMLDPLMTVLRPLAAIFTAGVAGVAVESLDGDRQSKPTMLTPLTPPSLKPIAEEPSLGCDCPECANLAPATTSSVSPEEEYSCGCCEPSSPETFLGRLRSGMDFSFGQLLGDIGWWFLLGVFLAAAITAFLPDELLPELLGTGMGGKLAALVVATPIYVCATASTPIAAALVLKGFSPGAALIFLLAGPATNAASLAMVSKILGKRSAAIYLAAILACSLLLGVLTDLAYEGFGLSTADWHFGALHEHASWFSLLMALLLLGLIFAPMLRSLAKRLARRPVF